MLKTPSYIPDKKELEKRLKGYIYFKDRVYTGISLSEFFQKQSFFYQEDKVDNAISELKGNVASSHNKIIQGKAQIILHKDQVPLFKSGNILITIMTTPLFLPAMKKAKAIITDEGGLTCHAAITARELGIPCIIGTKVATKIFKDNDLIEVDAEKGLIKKIKENTIEDNLPRLDFTKIAKLDWEKKWARNFTLLLCSYLGYQYYYSCRDLFEGNTFNAVLIRQFDEITTAYQLISDNERIGNYVVEKIDGKAETVKGYAEELRERTDLLSLRLKRPIYFLEKKKGFQQFETQLNEYSPIFFRLIRAANCLPGHLKESLLPIMDEIRIYTDPIFDEIDGYMKKIAEYISKKEKIPSKLCECLLREEVGEYFQKHRLPKISVLQERLRGCGLYFENGKETVLSKKETMGLIQAIFPAKENPELKGSSASPGIVKGLARIILDPQKPGLFKPGDIIIAEMTHPGYLLLMKQAKAIVTDAGGALCHAAVVAREFKIPCVVGTQIATEVLKDGDLIEVNAVKGVVKKIPEKQASKKKDKTKIKNPKNTIKLIIFDNYGVTLHGGYPDTMQHLAKEFHRDWKELQEIFYTKYFNQAVEQKISQQEAWKKAIDETKLPISVEEVKKIHYHYFQLNHDIINLAKKLSKRYTILLLTKNTKGQVEDADKKLGFRKIFPNFINTGEYGLTKTSPEMFKIIFKKFNVHPEECIYIDDQTINLEAPQRLGIHTIHYQNIKQLKEELKRII
ncbi:HAD-IA family hydrolase [Candidatus Woesearchaeota archaeon]|nr:HAD-IA family hydrolase [Candidatus Woesearchaeota archaeon]